VKNRTLIFTGDGKGKTTAAFGMVLRAAGHGQRVMVVQFLKSNDQSGELVACAQLPGVTVVQKGRGFVPKPEAPAYALHRETALEALAIARQVVAQGEHELVVLDEICGAVDRGLLDAEAVLELLHMPERKACVVLTGRNAPELLIAAADTVTEMRCVRHGYESGWKAQKGVEF